MWPRINIQNLKIFQQCNKRLLFDAFQTGVFFCGSSGRECIGYKYTKACAEFDREPVNSSV